MKQSSSGLLLLSAVAALVSNSVLATSKSDIEYANTNCKGNSYATEVTVGSNDDLWQIVRSYIDQNGEHYSADYWLTFKTKNELDYPWSSTDGSKKGVLFILPQGVSYTTKENLDYFRWDDPNAGHRNGPSFWFVRPEHC